jgi:2-keto-4-pentenoate hydratase/2-oxohepta-3-ene-1,7-dioic acid hydratase in catechol pathway
MKILTFRSKDSRKSARLRLGVLTDLGVLDIRAAAQAGVAPAALAPQSPGAFYQQGLSALPNLKRFVELALEHSAKHSSHWLLPEDSLRLGACVPTPGKILCVGLNYRNHAKESNMAIPPAPVLFSKFGNAVAAPGEPVPLPPGVAQYDYEAELCVVIGKRARYVPEEKALDYVLGYCNANDVSARELQMLTSQWLLGKTLDKFFPMGPYLLTADEAGDAQNYPVRCWLNGELRQNNNTSDMIFTIVELISFISRYMPLEPGDVISTGTPEGVIFGRKEKVWMKPGDVMTVEVGPLGKLTNPLVEESAQ